jgi:virulence-associated protein VapD
MEVLNRLLAEIRDSSGVPSRPFGKHRVYAIAFDLQVEILKKEYGDASYSSGYRDVRKILEEEGFTWVQGSVHFGSKTTSPVDCVLTVQRLARELPWFSDAVRDIRMLRIEEENDLRPALPQPKLALGLSG